MFFRCSKHIQLTGAENRTGWMPKAIQAGQGSPATHLQPSPSLPPRLTPSGIHDLSLMKYYQTALNQDRLSPPKHSQPGSVSPTGFCVPFPLSPKSNNSNS